MRIAVVGSGYWGKNLVRNFHNLGVLSLICDKDHTVLKKFITDYPNVKTCVAFSDVIHDELINGVVLATPAETHYSLAREALLAGKHVLVEKPLVLNEFQGRELIELAKGSRLTLMVGHLLQYHPVFLKLRDLVAAGELGRIDYIYSHRMNLGKIRREENILWSFAPHDISMILALAGEPPEKVIAMGGNYLHRKIADVTTTHLEFPSGIKAHIFVSWLHPFKEQKLVVVGDRKMAVFDDTLHWQDKLLLYPHEIRWECGIPVPNKAEPQRVQILEAEPLREECKHFLDCISNGCSPRTDGFEGLMVLKILNAAQRSMDNGNVQQTIDTDSQNYQTKNKQVVNCQNSIHHTAVIDDSVIIGDNVKVWHFTHVLKGSIIGSDCNIGQNVCIGPDVIIGNGCKIQNNVSLYKGVTLEDNVFCGPSVVFTNIINPRAHLNKMDQVKPTLVQYGATLGANSTIICGVTIGKFAFVGAGAVVTKNVLDFTLVVGNPAVIVGYVCICGAKLNNDFSCEKCGHLYKFNSDSLVVIR